MNRHGFGYQAVLTLISFVRILIESKLLIKPFTFCKEDESCFILGNGPSLKESVRKYQHIIKNKKSMCVNDFALSDYYQILEPSFYLLLDPAYWATSVSGRLDELRLRLIDTMIKKTSWEMVLFVPYEARKNMLYKQIEGTNERIKIVYFNRTPVSGFKCLRYWIYKKNIGMPHAQNVLVAGIFLALNMGFRNIYLCGADHSWLEDIVVNDSNIVCLHDRHFYDESEPRLIPFLKGHEEITTWKVYEIFQAYSKMFEGYRYVNDYARCLGAGIYNASEKSYIDEFERVSLIDVLMDDK